MTMTLNTSEATATKRAIINIRIELKQAIPEVKFSVRKQDSYVIGIWLAKGQEQIADSIWGDVRSIAGKYQSWTSGYASLAPKIEDRQYRDKFGEAEYVFAHQQ